jgi:hypothetical protein
MAKVKKMGLGGFFKGVLGGGAKTIAKAVSKSPVTKALAGGVGSAVKPKMAMAGAAAPKAVSSKLSGRTPVAGVAATKGIGSAVRGAASVAKPMASVGRSAMGAMTGMKKGAMAGMKNGGLAAGHKEADGIAKKGKTKAMAVKMAKGGRTC